MKKWMALLVLLTMLLSLAACAPKSAPPADEPAQTPAQTPEKTPEPPPEEPANSDAPLSGKRIGCTIVYKGDEWCASLAANLEQTALEYGATITVEDGDINDETQSKQIENMIANDVDMMFIDPATPDGCTEALMRAVDAGIPIIIYDCYWNEDLAVTSVTWDQPLTGELIANYLIDYVAKNPDAYPDGAADVVLLELNTSSAAMQRTERFMEVLEEKAPGIKIINRQDCEGNRERGANAITNIVEPFDFVVSAVDNGAWGAVSAIQARGLSDVKVLSMGAYGAEPFEALQKNDPIYLACVVVDPKVIAAGVYDAAARHLKGERVDKTTYIDLSVADASNVTNYWSFD